MSWLRGEASVIRNAEFYGFMVVVKVDPICLVQMALGTSIIKVAIYNITNHLGLEKIP